MHIGEIIHRLRKDRKMSLLELSQKSGVALATLSRIENGRMTGTLKSHINICKAFEIDITEIYKDLALSSKKAEMRSKKARPDIFFHSKNISSEMLVSNVIDKKMMPLIIRIAKGGSTHKEVTKLNIEKFVYIMAGKIEANIGEEQYNLTKDDTLYFESSLSHYFKNTGPGEAILICVVCPPLI